MANYSEHIEQAKYNLKFLDSISDSSSFWDWKVTICFYTAVHLINAHLAQKANLHYRTHNRVDQAINPYVAISPTKLSEENYLAYTKLLGLSRRARYLVHEKTQNASEDIHFTFEKHFIKGLRHLDKVLKFMKSEYNVDFEVFNIKSDYYKTNELDYFIPSNF